MKIPNELLALFVFCLSIKAAMCGEWEKTIIKDFKIEGGTVSNWIQKWMDESEKAGSSKEGFYGIRYLYPLKDRSVGDARINVSGAPMITVLKYIADACGFEYRVKNDYVLIQPDKKYNSIIMDINNKLLSGIGLDPKRVVNKQSLVEALTNLGVEIDDSPDSMTIIKDKAVINVIAIDQNLMESIINVASSGLLVSVHR